MNTVSIQDMRFDFGRVKSALDRGEELTLTYRNKPLARLLPFAEKGESGDDPALTFGIDAEQLEPLSNAGIDRAIYG